MGEGRNSPRTLPANATKERGCIAELYEFTGKSGVGQPFGQRFGCCTGRYEGDRAKLGA